MLRGRGSLVLGSDTGRNELRSFAGAAERLNRHRLNYVFDSKSRSEPCACCELKWVGNYYGFDFGSKISNIFQSSRKNRGIYNRKVVIF